MKISHEMNVDACVILKGYRVYLRENARWTFNLGRELAIRS